MWGDQSNWNLTSLSYTTDLCIYASMLYYAWASAVCQYLQPGPIDACMSTIQLVDSHYQTYVIDIKVVLHITTALAIGMILGIRRTTSVRIVPVPNVIEVMNFISVKK